MDPKIVTDVLEATPPLHYYKGRDNLACTIFVPFACGNDCPFCTSKDMYKDYKFSRSYLDEIIKWIRILNNSDVVSEFVLTGGEPLFNLDITRELIREMKKPVYINTTFPMIPGKLVDTLEFLSNEVAGVNVSRHNGILYNVSVARNEIVKEIKNYVRINSLILPEAVILRPDDVIDFINYWADDYRMVNFRADYRKVKPNTLKNRDHISNFLLEHYKYEYANGCLVCNSEFYSDEKNKVICYHRGLESSCVVAGNRCYVNDIIIDIKGDIYKDWNMQYVDMEFVKWLLSTEKKEEPKKKNI
jgi:organic radical activating enzyme